MSTRPTRDDDAIHDHDRGLAFDLSTLVERRHALKLFAGAGLVALAGCGSSKLTSGSATTSATTSTSGSATGSATIAPVSGTGAIPEETAGPYPADGSNGVNVLAQSGIVRRDIRSSFGTSTTVASGVPTTVELTIVKADTVAPISGAAVYLWHCDVDGNYSLYSSAITKENYLRGVQETDASGTVSFTTIFPACYSDRWPHIHYEVYPTLAAATSAGSKIATSQLALPEAICRTVYATSGYSQSIRNLSQVSLATDNVFSDGAGRETPAVAGDVTTGLVLSLTAPVG